MDILNKPTALVLFSGGKDSFITACDAVARGYRVVLLSCQGGSLIGEQHLAWGAERLVKRFGSDSVEYAGIIYTGSAMSRLNEEWAQLTWKELGERFPLLINCQVQCLHCQTAMWTCAIALAFARGINTILCGYKNTDVFCTGLKSYLDGIKAIAEGYKIHCSAPLWDMVDDYERDCKMGLYGFNPQVLDPKCLMGRPPVQLLSEDAASEMKDYVRDVLAPKMKDMLPDYTRVYKTIRVTLHTFIESEKPDFCDESH